MNTPYTLARSLCRFLLIFNTVISASLLAVGSLTEGLLGLIAILVAIFWMASSGMTIGVGFLWIIMKERASPATLVLVHAETSESAQRAKTEPHR